MDARASLFKAVKARLIFCRGAREVGAESRVQEVVIVPHQEVRLGEKVGKISAQILANALQRPIGSRFTQRLKRPY